MQNQPQPFTPNQYFKTQTILHLGFLGAMLAFAIVTSALVETWQIEWNYTDEIFFFVVPMAAIAGVFLSKLIFQKQLGIAKTLPTLKSRLVQYQTARVIKYACIEAPALLSLVVFLNTENAYFLIIALFLIFYFFIQKPTKEMIETDLNLNNEMKQQFRRSDQVIN